jgi:uncharacterized protein involved in tolerance to divalent cations
MYSWKGNFEKGEEYIMLLKIRSADFPMVAKAIARIILMRSPAS